MKKHYTSKEQSKRLIGILHERSADLCYVPDKEFPIIRRESPLSHDELPCWSTGALLDMLLNGEDDPFGGSHTHNWHLVEDGDEYISDNDYDLVELLVRAIERIYKQ